MLIFMRASFKAKIAGAAVALLAFGGMAALAAPSASATTLTCTNIATATVSPFGCGGLQSAGTAHGMLDLAHINTSNTQNLNAYNSLVTVQPDASVTSEDWTAFAVNGLTTGGPGGLGEYVAMDTPDGLIASFSEASGQPVPGNCSTLTVATTSYTNTMPCASAVFNAGANDLCLSVENAAHVPGTNGKLREWDVLRTCNTNGAFTYGTKTTPGKVVGGFANLWQVWSPVISGSGYIMINTWLFNHNNVNYVLDITGNGGAGSVVQAYPENDQINEEWGLIGCTQPASNLGGVVSPPYVNCP